MLGGVDSYAQAINAQGGICGRTIEVVALDDGFDPSRQLANMRRLNEEFKVLLAGTILTVGVGDYVTRNNLPVLALGGAMEPVSSEQPTVFPAIGSAHQFTGAMVANYLEVGVVEPGDRVALMYDTEIFNLEPVKDELAAQWEAAGLDVVSVDPFNLSDLDCTSLVNKVRSANIDFWDFQGFGFTLCIPAAERAGFTPRDGELKGWGGWAASSAGIPELAGPAADGLWMTGISQISDTYRERLTSAHPDTFETDADLASPTANGGYAGMKVFEQVAHATGGVPTRDDLVEAFQTVSELDIQGSTATVSWAPDCKGGIAPAPGSTYRLAQWRLEDSDRFSADYQGPELSDNPYIDDCESTRLAAERY